MRRAELVTAALLAALSLYFMWKSAELPIGWIQGEGPGGGAFPFWLSAGMLVCSIWIGVRWLLGIGPLARSTETYLDGRALRVLAIGGGSLTMLIGAIHFIGVYGAVPFFLVFYMRFVGRHPWGITGALATCIPVVTFFFFEIALNITLPKGLTEPLFYPLYDLFL